MQFALHPQLPVQPQFVQPELLPQPLAHPLPQPLTQPQLLPPQFPQLLLPQHTQIIISRMMIQQQLPPPQELLLHIAQPPMKYGALVGSHSMLVNVYMGISMKTDNLQNASIGNYGIIGYVIAAFLCIVLAKRKVHFRYIFTTGSAS
mgnify:CR=1 FL=1